MLVKREIPINSDRLQDELYIYPISSFLWKYLTADSGGENIPERAGLLISIRTLICHQILLKQSSAAVWKVFKYRAFSGLYSFQIQETTDQKKLRIWKRKSMQISKGGITLRIPFPCELRRHFSSKSIEIKIFSSN